MEGRRDLDCLISSNTLLDYRDFVYNFIKSYTHAIAKEND